MSGLAASDSFFSNHSNHSICQFQFCPRKMLCTKDFQVILIGSPRASGDIHGLRLCVGLLPRCFEPFGRQDIRIYQDISTTVFLSLT